jgi:ABC-type uncharacterized transport system auxiliary subunit
MHLTRTSIQPLVTRREAAALTLGAVSLALAALLSACGSHPTVSQPATAAGAATDVLANASDLRTGGLAMLTPTASSDRQADRQSAAEIFADALHSARPDLPMTALPATLSAINAAGLAEPYGHLYASYKETGLFDGKALRQIGQAVHARYLLQLNLAAYDQENSNGMFSMMGLSLGKQQSASVRLMAQLWDSSDGKIVWERSDEASEKKRSLLRSRSIDMKDVMKAGAADLIKQLPH